MIEPNSGHIVYNFGDTINNFKEDELPIEKLAELAPIAQKIIDRVGW